MKLVVQRVSQASVEVEAKRVAEIGQGLCVLVGFANGDHEAVLPKAIDKLANLRIFPDNSGRFDKSCLDIQGEILIVPQFTLYADTSKGRRPDFFEALEPKQAEQFFSKLFKLLKDQSKIEVQAGIFGAQMQVSLTNDGPVTIILDI